MKEVKYAYKVMWYDDSWMEEPRVVTTCEDEQTAYNFIEWKYESEFHYIEREIVE
jgi:hypothetical protein